MTSSKAIRAQAPPPPREIVSQSVVQQPTSLMAGPGGGKSFVLWMASIADTFCPWGTNVALRDRQLRDFWPTESHIASAVATCAMANSSYQWSLEGPERTVDAVHEILNSGIGWRRRVIKSSIDLYTQDNGGFLEIVRNGKRPDSPIIGLEHLDASRCLRTGDVETPVIYQDINGRLHEMPWYSIILLEEFPSPIETMYNVQYCAVTRVLRTAQIMRDMFIYRGEKIGGRFAEAIYVIGGVSQQTIKDVEERMQEKADNKGLVRYIGPLVIGSLDPGTSVSTATVEMKSLPESYDYDAELKWYIASLALGFGRDYQDFAPLPGHGIGTATEGEILHMKARGKGPAAFMSMTEEAFNYRGVMPRTVTFSFDQLDIVQEQSEAQARKTRAESIEIWVNSGVITPQVARQIMLDDGDLKLEYVKSMGEEDITPTVPLGSGEKPDETEEDVVPMETPEEGEIVEMARKGGGPARFFRARQKSNKPKTISRGFGRGI